LSFWDWCLPYRKLVQAMADEVKKNVRRIALGLLGVLVILFGYLSYIQVIEGEALAANSLNRRSAQSGMQIERGKILDRNGKVLAFSERQPDGQYVRRYPYGAVLAHVVGYSNSSYGNTGIESRFNRDLSGIKNPWRVLGPLANLWNSKAGNNVVTTIDAELQTIAYRALGNRRGAVVALNPKTGAILAMVSKPSFNPEDVDTEWKILVNDPESRLLNRAVQGLYPPGSTLKVMVAEAALREKVTDTKQLFTCEGTWKIGKDYELSESHHQAHGKVNLEDALAVSCNITFGKLTVQLGPKRFAEAFTRFGFDRPTGLEIGDAPSELPDFNRLSEGELAQTGIGQGSLLVTPLRMAMIAAAMANQGNIMTPYLVTEINAPDGSQMETYSGKLLLTATSPELAQIVSKMMVSVVDRGTGSAAGLGRGSVAGKTGTAENPHGEPHAWFIGFAPVDNPQIAVAVILENSGYGGAEAAPVARQIFAGALR